MMPSESKVMPFFMNQYVDFNLLHEHFGGILIWYMNFWWYFNLVNEHFGGLADLNICQNVTGP